jgi:hypothetical protein
MTELLEIAMPRPKTYRNASERQREYLLRKRLRMLDAPGSSHFYHMLLRAAYADLGYDISKTNVLPWLSADLIYRAAHRGQDDFREFFKIASELPYVELNRLGEQPKIRIAPSVR